MKIKLCDHVEFIPASKTYRLAATLNMNDRGSFCSACGTKIDLSPANEGGWNFEGGRMDVFPPDVRQWKQGVLQLDLIFMNEYGEIDKKKELPFLLRQLADQCENGISRFSKIRNYNTDMYCTIKNERDTK